MNETKDELKNIENFEQFNFSFRQKLNDYLKHQAHGKCANKDFWIKAALYFSAIMVCYSLLYIVKSYSNFASIYLILGVLIFLYNLNTSHDAAHYSAFKGRKNNIAFFYFNFFLLGNSAWLWRNNHIEKHHPSPNVIHIDPDLFETPLLRIAPHQKRRFFHRFQILYAPMLYALHAPLYYWIQEQFTIGFHKQMPLKEKVLAYFTKAIHLTLMIFLPFFFTSFSFAQVLLLFILSLMIQSWILVFALGVSHLNNQSITFLPENGDVAHPIAVQLYSSLDYGGSSKLTHFLFGGFNVHGMHHVIPDVCHIYYLELGNIFSTLAKKYNIKYKSVSYLAMLVSHFTLLWKLGSPSVKSEVIVSRKIKHA